MPTAAQVDAEIARLFRVIPIPTFGVGTAGAWGTCWTGAYPGSGGRACSDGTSGALLTPPANDSGRLAFAENPPSVAPTQLFLVDRLIDVSGLAANSTGSQPVSHPALTRETTGALVVPWVEIVTAPTGTVAADLTLTYTNQANASGKVSVTSLPATWSNTARRAVPLNLAPGDTGIRSIQSMQLSAVASSAGDIALVLSRLIQLVPQSTTSTTTAYARRSYVAAVRGGLPRVRAGACVSAYAIGSTATLANTFLMYAVTEGLG